MNETAVAQPRPSGEFAFPVPQTVGVRSLADHEPGPTAQDSVGPGAFPGIRRPFRSLLWILHLGFGTVCLLMFLAILAAVPGLNFLTLGYLVEPQRRIALSGRLRDGFPLMKLAPRLGVIVFFALLLMIPIRAVAVRLSDAMVILGPNHDTVQQLQSVLWFLKVILGTHLVLAILHGGTPGSFLRPLRNCVWVYSCLTNVGARRKLTDGIQLSLDVLDPVRHFWLGFRSFLGAILWLAIPSGLMVAFSAPGKTNPVLGLFSFLGIVLMVFVTSWLPMLQVHQAAENRFRSIFAVSTIRRLIRTVPLTWAVSTILLCAMTFPLYLAKIKLLPGDALLLATPFFILVTYPTRLLMAWTYHRGMSREKTTSFFWSGPIRLVMFGLLMGYSLFLFLTPAVSELGRSAPLENQAFLGPVPYAQWRPARD